jgi:predicted anti-sigma-YlaC factor YlaD
MDCARIRESISADLDGEELPVAREVFHRHLAGCPACCAHQVDLGALHRRTRLTSPPVVPDLSGRILLAIDDARRADEPASTVQGLRLGVTCIALVQLGVSLPALLLGSDAGLPVHAARHLGSFGVALAIGLLVAAWKPQRIAGLLPLATALVICLVASSVLNVATHHAAATAELGHATEVLGLVALWLLGRTQRDPIPILHAL